MVGADDISGIVVTNDASPFHIQEAFTIRPTPLGQVRLLNYAQHFSNNA